MVPDFMEIRHLSSPRTDEEFLTQLEAVFLARGFRNVTVAKLAEDMKCSRRRLYEYAGSKDDLFLLVIGRFFENIRNEGIRISEQEIDLDQKIRRYLEVGVEGAKKLSEAIQEDIDHFPASKKIYDDHQKLRIYGLREMIDAGIESGVYREVNARLAAEMMLLIVKRIREPGFQREVGLTYAQALTESASLLRHGLLR